MDAIFQREIEKVVVVFKTLVESKPIRYPLGVRTLPEKGIYLFSEKGAHQYVGRSDSIRDRLNMHQRESADINSASFAALIAKKDCGIKAVSYKAAAPGSHYSDQPDFRKAFSLAKKRIRQMEIKVIEETDPVRQALLELYTASVLKTPYNDFSNH